MTYRVRGALIASVSALALILAADETFARGRPGFTTMHSSFAPRFHRHNNAWVVWPGGGGFFYGPSISEPFADVNPPSSTDVRYTDTYGVPWDWAHRYPPNVVPSDRPYVPSCPSETVTVPGRGGTEQTVNVMRCY